MMKSNKTSHPVLSRVLALALATGCVAATSAFAAPLLPEVESEKPVSVSWDAVSDVKYQVRTGVFEVVENDAGNGDGTKVVIRLVDGDDGQSYAYYSADSVEALDFEYVTVGAVVLENAQSITTTLVSVSHADESKFSPEEWSEILEMIDAGTVVWED